MRCVRGIEVNDDTVGIETMRATCLGGPGHYLGSDQTLSLMQTEYVYPVLADRSSPKEWQEKGRPDLIQNAIARKKALIAAPTPATLDTIVDAEIRKRFNIHLT